MAYATVQDVKDHLRITEPGAGQPDQTTDDDVINALLNGVSDAIDRVTGRTFTLGAAASHSFEVPGAPSIRSVDYAYAASFYAPTFDRNRGELLFDDDLVSVNSVTNADGTTIDPDNVRLMPLNHYPKYGLKLINGQEWQPNEDGLVVVNGVWAYAPTVPSAISEACIIWSASEYRKRTGEGESAGFVTPSGIRILPSGMPKTVAVILQSFVKTGMTRDGA